MPSLLRWAPALLALSLTACGDDDDTGAPNAGSGGSSMGRAGAPAGRGGSTSGGGAGAGGGPGGSPNGGSGGTSGSGGAGGGGDAGNDAGGSGGAGGGASGGTTGGAGGAGGGGATGGAGGGGATGGAGGGGATGGSSGAGGGGATGGSSGAGGGGAVPVFDVERYHLEGTFDWERNLLDAKVTVTLAPASIGLASAVLDIEQSALTVKAVRTPGGEALPYGAANDKLTVALAGHVAPGQAPAIVVEYEALASAGGALVSVPARTGGPSDARVAFTASEPLGVSQWMPCHNDPGDRAFFSTDLRVPEGERAIANGDLVADEPDGAGGRRVAYATSYTLPTYLMAFATGGFEIESATGPQGLPLAIWHRRGAGGDYAAMLAELARLVAHFESLLGVPYPFEKYAVVALPGLWAGGIEHAGITFQRETVTTNPASAAGDLATTAHELGHQWFGDLVTVATWDDLWIKEGMATLLQAEGTRAYLDEGGTGVLNGDEFYANDGAAIRDVSLPPGQKYTSGPYGRAAWLLSQIRHGVGEAAFWGGLRRVLTAHAYGNIGTDAFLEEFRADLGEAAFAKTKAAVDAKDVYAVQVAAPQAPGGPPRVTLVDAEGSVVQPMRARWLRADGSVDALTLAPGQAVELAREAPGDLLVIDPDDLHLEWPLSQASANNFRAHVAPLLRPATPDALARFTALAGAHQLATLSTFWVPEPPEAFAAFLGALDSHHAEATALAVACERAIEPGAPPAWRAAIAAVLGAMPGYRGASFFGRESCGEAADVAAIFAAEWAKIAADPLDPSVPEGHLVYLAPFWTGLPPALARSAWGAVAYRGRSVHERGLGANTLRNYIEAFGNQIAGAERDAWRAMATPLVAESRLVEVLPAAITVLGNVGGPSAAANADARAAIAQMLRDPVRSELNLRRPVCAARKLCSGDQAAWGTFAASLQDVPDPALQTELLLVGQNPGVCSAFFDGTARAPRPEVRPPPAEALEGKGGRAAR